MDYNELNKDNLAKILKDRNIEYNQNLNKEGLINLLINSDTYRNSAH